MPAVSNRTLLLAAASAGVSAGLIARAALKRSASGSLQGQVVLITGGSRGLGLSLAREFAREKCEIAICARNPAELEAARADLERRGARVLALPCDVAEEAQVQRTIDQVIGRFGRVDVLVNNAGEIQVGPLESMTLEDFERAMQIMFWGTVYPTMTVLPHLLARKRGRIVNITSIGGKVAVPHLLPYTCAKFAAVGFSEGLRAELSGKGIKVVTIAPGLMRTGSYLNAIFKGNQDAETAWFSLSSTMPAITMSGDRAARQIVNAAKRGDSEKILTLPANLLARFHGLFPGATADILGVVNRLLLPSGIDRSTRRGREAGILQNPWFKLLTVLGRLGAQRFLQNPEQHAPAKV